MNKIASHRAPQKLCMQQPCTFPIALLGRPLERVSQNRECCLVDELFRVAWREEISWLDILSQSADLGESNKIVLVPTLP